MVVVHAAEIRVLGATAIEDYHAHLMRLDRASLIPGDDRGIDAHCLDLMASGAILIGAGAVLFVAGGALVVTSFLGGPRKAGANIKAGFTPLESGGALLLGGTLP